MPVIKYSLPNNEELEIRYDEAEVVEVNRCEFRADAKIGSVKKTDEGYIRGEVPVAKVGVMTYLLADGTTRNEFVPAETLFNEDSMATLRMQPITDTHPPEILLDSKTIKRRRIGTTGENIRRQDEYLISPVAITDEDGVNSVSNGRTQFSPGYRCFVIKKDGSYNGVHYDAIQIKRVYNHLALCDKARGGSDLKLNFDSFSVEEIERIDGFEITNIEKETSTMLPKYRIDGIDYEASQEVINYITKLQAKNDELSDNVTKISNEKTVLQAKVDEQKEKIDSLEKRDIKGEIAAGVKNRLSLINLAKATLDEEEFKKIDDSTSDLDIKKAIIKAKSPNANLDGKDEVYIQARVDSIKEALDFDSTAIDTQRQSSASRHDGSNLDIVEKAQLDEINRVTSAYQNFGK